MGAGWEGKPWKVLDSMGWWQFRGNWAPLNERKNSSKKERTKIHLPVQPRTCLTYPSTSFSESQQCTLSNVVMLPSGITSSLQTDHTRAGESMEVPFNLYDFGSRRSTFRELPGGSWYFPGWNGIFDATLERIQDLSYLAIRWVSTMKPMSCETQF